MQTVYTDLLILRLLTDRTLESAGLAQRMRRFFEWPVDIGLVQRNLHDHGLIEDYLDLLMLTLDPECETIVIEGAFLDDPEMMKTLSARLTTETRSWRMIQPACRTRREQTPRADGGGFLVG